MIERGYDEEFARRTFSQLEGFGSYGFPESHAASFAFIAYASSWLKCWHPDVFCAALLNAQPMGFYAPAQIVRDAREHGVEVRPVDINTSRWDCTLEPTAIEGRFAMRLGLRMICGMQGRRSGSPGRRPGRRCLSAMSRMSGAAVVFMSRSLVRLAEADAFQPSMRLPRRDALWAIKALRDNPLPLFAVADGKRPTPETNDEAVRLKAMTAGHEVDRGLQPFTGLTLRRHPGVFLPKRANPEAIITCAEANVLPDRRKISTGRSGAGASTPGSAKGVMFITIEDETGVANLVVMAQPLRETASHHPDGQHAGSRRPRAARRPGRAYRSGQTDRPIPTGSPP